jgi:hypothetical protein
LLGVKNLTADAQSNLQPLIRDNMLQWTHFFRTTTLTLPEDPSMKAMTSLAAAFLLLLTATYRCLASDDAPRPNVLFLMSDDHCAQAVSAYGGRLATVCPTPNIDRIAEQGLRFNNCFVTNSICTPSRAAIFTGKYAHKNGVYKFTALNQAQPTLPKMMRRAGYRLPSSASTIFTRTRWASTSGRSCLDRASTTTLGLLRWATRARLVGCGTASAPGIRRSIAPT